MENVASLLFKIEASFPIKIIRKVVIILAHNGDLGDPKTNPKLRVNVYMHSIENSEKKGRYSFLVADLDFKKKAIVWKGAKINAINHDDMYHQIVERLANYR